MRTKVAKAVERACDIAGGSGGVSKEDYDKAMAENKKLKYRVNTLCRELDAIDGGRADTRIVSKKSGGSGGGIKFYTLPLGPYDNMAPIFQVVALMLG